jgi:hypothetical protein
MSTQKLRDKAKPPIRDEGVIDELIGIGTSFIEEAKELKSRPIKGAGVVVGTLWSKDEFIDAYGKAATVTGTSFSSPQLIRHWIETHVPTTQIEEITVLASAILDGKDKAVKWLSQPNAATDDRAPIDLIGEKEGFERVKNLLLRIEYGVLA